MVVLLCCTVFKGTFSSTNEEIKNEKSIHDELDFDYSTPTCKFYTLVLKNPVMTFDFRQITCVEMLY